MQRSTVRLQLTSLTEKVRPLRSVMGAWMLAALLLRTQLAAALRSSRRCVPAPGFRTMKSGRWFASTGRSTYRSRSNSEKIRSANLFSISIRRGELARMVPLSISEPQCGQALAGLVNASDSLSPAEDYDLAVFDVTGQGKMADATRELTPTIGDSMLADRLEEDRIFALEFMQKCGISVSPWEKFTNPADAIRYIKQRNTRQVFKPIGEQADKSTTYVSKSAEDMLRYFDVLFRQA